MTCWKLFGRFFYELLLGFVQVSCTDWFGFSWTSNAGDGLGSKWFSREKRKEQINCFSYSITSERYHQVLEEKKIKRTLNNNSNGKTGAFIMLSFIKEWEDKDDRTISKWQHFFHHFGWELSGVVTLSYLSLLPPSPYVCSFWAWRSRNMSSRATQWRTSFL